MSGSDHPLHLRGRTFPRQIGLGFVALVALLVALGSATFAAAYSYGGGGATGRFAATFETRAVGDPTVVACRGLGPDGAKVEGRYLGTMTIGGEEFGIHFVLEALIDRATGLGSAEGRWQLTDPRSSAIIGRGELIGVVATGDPPSEADSPTEVDSPDPDLELQGLLIGTVNPADPDMPTQRLIGNFTASLGDGGTFPHLKGIVGDPTGVGDPTDGELLPAVLIASEGC